MHIAAAAVLVTIASFVKGDGDASNCKHPPSVEKFASSYYTAQIVMNDPSLVKSVVLEGGEAAISIYTVLRKVFGEHRLCNADEAAYAASHSVARADNFTLATYFDSVAYSVGMALNEYGLLNCDNAVSRALEYNAYVVKNFQGQDEKKLVSYLHADIYGWVEYFLSLGLKLEDFAIKSTKIYNKEVKEILHTDKCKLDTFSD